MGNLKKTKKPMSQVEFKGKEPNTSTLSSVTLANHMKQRFSANEDAWIFVYNYFKQYLNMLLLAYATTGQQPCVIFDIDHTVLYYWTPLIASMTPAHLMGPMIVRRELRITSSIVLNLYNLFLHYKIPIYFVTGRPLSKTNIKITEEELATLGFKNYKQIYYMPNVFDDVGSYKQRARESLKPVLFNVGDQWTDFVNAPVDKKYDDNAFLLFKMEPGCDWGLKLITPKSHPFRSNNSNVTGSINSVFDTVAPPLQIPLMSEYCSECGHLKIYH